MRRTVAGAIFLSLCVFALRGQAQHKADDEPILEARDSSGGCCSLRYDRTYLRVFADGRVEWEVFDEQAKPSLVEGTNVWTAFIAHKETLSKKKLKSIQWAIENMKGLKEFYVGKE